MNRTPIVRKLTVADAPAIRRLVNHFALDGKMLPLSYNQIYERLRNFWAVEERGKIVGCGALKVTWKDLGEIRSLAVSVRSQRKGYGRILLKRMLKEARELGMKKVFVLTYTPGFFRNFGFEPIAKHRLPHKIWLDCINCPKFPRCDETALILDLAPAAARRRDAK